MQEWEEMRRRDEVFCGLLDLAEFRMLLQQLSSSSLASISTPTQSQASVIVLFFDFVQF